MKVSLPLLKLAALPTVKPSELNEVIPVDVVPSSELKFAYSICVLPLVESVIIQL